MKIDLTTLVTESRNAVSENIDMLATIDMLKVINQEDQKVAIAVEAIIPEIAKVVDLIVNAFQSGGRLIYTGAGTSGRYSSCTFRPKMIEHSACAISPF